MIDHQIQTPSRVRELNDTFRGNGPAGAGHWVLTRGVQALGPKAVAFAVRAVRNFSQFDEDNDPHAEHDFGAFSLCGDRMFWKIDYYDLALEAGSEDPANATIATRVLTVMLAEDY
jgi:hypothetical protein